MEIKNKISLILFDMDGLMFDTQTLGIQTWIKAGKSQGIDISESIVTESFGLDIHGAKKVFKKHLGNNFPYYDIRSLRLKYTNDHINENGVPVKNGLYELIEFLDEKTVFKAVATSTERERTERLLCSAGVKDKFDIIICGDEVSNGKPEPEIFLAAARKMNCKTDECVVLEDSLNGIIAASKANMIPLLVSDAKKPSKEIEKLTAKTFNSLYEVKNFFKTLDL
ncbi:HAD family hydrolase [Methanobacterium petrolearium]|uniref:HAD family hydrolase n=1 Tax=Methanobacterium petrolearium TaxID=710190 RepID=UPI001AE7B0D1|nr:HAD family phosphatase [Methanobacterium petrolearium]MBP1946400.1 HAD superfamily hydrolase (TIGR01509 family) [Methanobacterium petrolearium]